MSFLVSKQPMFNPQGVTDAYELLYCFASYSDEQNEPTDEEIEEAKEYLRANFDCIFNNKIAYVRFSHRLLQANFHEMFMKDKLIIEVTAEMLTDPSTLQ